MKTKRIIPVLLMQQGGLVKTVKFKNPAYIGDPINSVKIFNEKEVDELVILDIEATLNRRPPNLSVIRQIASECFMPLAYGGGITSLEEIKQIFHVGVEKAVINTACYQHRTLISEGARLFGSQSITASIDVGKNFFGSYTVYIEAGKKNIKKNPVDYARELEAHGAGEIFLNAIEKDGTMTGYDLELIHKVSAAIKIPVIACGGAGSVEHFQQALQHGASAVAAGSMFVFHGPHKAVLINFPPAAQLKKLYEMR